MKEESKQWIPKGEPVPEEVKTVSPPQKLIVTVFGIVMALG